MNNKIRKLIEPITIIVLLGVFIILFFDSHIIRLGVSIISFLKSIYYSVISLFIELEEPTLSYEWMLNHVGEGSFVNLLNIDFDSFKSQLAIVGQLFISGSFWTKFFNNLSNKLILVVDLINLFMILIVLYMILKMSRKFVPDDYTGNTKALVKLKKFESNVKEKIGKVLNFLSTIYSKKIMITLLLLFVSYLQLFTILFDLLANYYMFMATFNFNIIWQGVILHLVDFLPVYFSLPLIIRLITIYIVFDKIRLNVANQKMRRILNTNLDFLDNSGNQILINGASRTGKNALATTLSIAYVQEYLPMKLIEIMQEVERKFTFINYPELRDYIEAKKQSGSYKNQFDIYSDFYIEEGSNEGLFIQFLSEDSIVEVWDELSIEHVSHALSEYAVAYFLYIHETPFAVGNYTIMYNDPVNPNEHYFNVSKVDCLNETIDDYLARKANAVINYDYLRLGKKYKDYQSNNSYVPDIGLYAITEIGKERGSYESIKNVNYQDEKINQKNDRFRERIQIWSHISTIRFRTLFKVIADEQRNYGLSAEMRSTFENIILLDRRKIKKGLALRSWAIEEMICLVLINTYDSYSLERAEIKKHESVFSYLFKKLIKHINLYYLKRVNKYSFSAVQVYSSNGSVEVEDEEIEVKKLYIINKLAYSGRYETANLRKLFLNEMSKARLDFDELRTFNSLSPSPGDYKYMNSFAYKDLFDKK